MKKLILGVLLILSVGCTTVPQKLQSPAPDPYLAGLPSEVCKTATPAECREAYRRFSVERQEAEAERDRQNGDCRVLYADGHWTCAKWSEFKTVPTLAPVHPVVKVLTDPVPGWQWRYR